MLRWTSIAVGVVAATVAAKVLAQDTSPPASPVERRMEVPPTGQVGPQGLTGFHLQSGLPIQAVAPLRPHGDQGPPARAEAKQQRELAQFPQARTAPPETTRNSDERPRRYDRGYGVDATRSARRAYSRRRANSPRQDWPLDQGRRFEGPRDAYGGRWIYVRPAPQPRYRSRYAGQMPHGYERNTSPHRYADLYRPYERRLTDDPGYDRYPYNLGRRRDF